MDTGRFKLKTKLMNQHFINELDKIGLQLINITGTFDGKLMVLLEEKIWDGRCYQAAITELAFYAY
jgi:hypothetical protein